MSSALNLLRPMGRFSKARSFAAIAVLGLVTLPSWAAADTIFPPAPELTTLENTQPVADNTSVVDQAALPQLVEAEFNKLMTKMLGAAQCLAESSPATPDGIPAASTESAAPAAQGVPADSAAAASTKEQTATADTKTRQTEIDSLNAQIAEEKLRLADLEEQLSTAQESLATITGVDSEGFIRNWLVLGPIAVDAKVGNHDEDSAKEFLDRNYVAPDATPKAGDIATIDGTQRTWTSVKSSDYAVDLAKVAQDQELDCENAAYVGIAYITSEQEVNDVRLSIGSDDDSVWRLNGNEVIRCYGGRGVDKDQNSADGLTLKQGVNILSFTVLNGEGATAAAARFVDQNGDPIQGLKVQIAPANQPVAQTDESPIPGTQDSK